MRIIYNILLVSLIAFLNTGKAKLLGKYCGNVFGNELNISADYNLSNISANIFGENLVCNNEVFILDNNSLIFSKNKSDCLNKKLIQFGACPCPPNVRYITKTNSLNVYGTPVGNIILNHCN